MTKTVPAGARQHSTAGPYSSVLLVSGQELVVLSGQGPLDPDGRLVGSTIEEHTVATMENCRRLLAGCDLTFADVFRVNVYLADLEHWERFNAVYAPLMPEPRPVRTTVGVNLLLGMLVEIDMWAVR